MNIVQFLMNQSKKLFSVFFLSIVLISVGCRNRSNVQSKDIVLHEYKRIYYNSIQSGDLASGIHTLNYLVVSSPDSLAYIDSLSNLYFKMALFKQSIYWCKQALKYNDSNKLILNILANSYLRSSDYLNAINLFEKLIMIEKKAEHHLHKAEAEYNMRRLLECIQSTQVAETVDVNYDFKYFYKDTVNMTRVSNLKCALFNYRGLAHYDLGNLKEAETCFRLSLKYDPQFLLAQLNLATVLQRIQQEKNEN
jgi:tetratricopeptide (TPR) repeat protein